jgi:hypothetical protein
MTTPLPQVLDASVALVVEGYLSLGADWWTALETAQGAGEQKPPDQKPVKSEEQKVAENNAVLANIMSGLGGSSFGGAA